jgi:anti-anti-sigma regulatory factor
MATYRHFDSETVNDVVVARLVDRRLADTMAINELQDELLLLLDREPTKKLLVNFRGVMQCSTSVINALLRAKKKLLTQGGQIKLCELHPDLDGTVFHIHDTEAEALAGFSYV